jgi:hypothetical protein
MNILNISLKYKFKIMIIKFNHKSNNYYNWYIKTFVDYD